MYDILVIGGGASGMMSAIISKKTSPELSVSVIEKSTRLLGKVAVSGNGQCNITNQNCSEEYYHGDSSFAAEIIKKFTPEMQKDFFLSLGLPVFFREDKKGYPNSLQATSVVDALRFYAEEIGVNIILDTEVKSVKKNKGNFDVFSGDKKFSARAVIVAAGGIAGGKLGNDSGYKILKSFGHKSTELRPSIVQLKSNEPFIKALQGIKLLAKLTAKIGEKTVTAPVGDLLFTDYGISGPAVLILSSYYQNKDFTVYADLIPNLSQVETEKILKLKRANLPTRKSEEFLAGLINRKLGLTIIKHLGIDLKKPFSEITDEELERTNKTVHALKFNIIGTNGFQNAQVTSGGIHTTEFYPETLMSKKEKGLFAAGEILNVDGECGGYNLSFAWASGYLAGQGTKKYLEENR